MYVVHKKCKQENGGYEHLNKVKLWKTTFCEFDALVFSKLRYRGILK